MKILFGATAIAALLIASPAFGGFGSKHRVNETTHETKTQVRDTTKHEVEHRRVDVPDVTHYIDVNREHPVIHRTEKDLWLHHVEPKDTYENENRTHVAPEQIEQTRSAIEQGQPAPAREHTVYRYHDTYPDVYETRTHEHHVTDYDWTIHHEIHDVTVQPINRQHIVTTVIPESHYVHSSDVQHQTVEAAPRVIVKHTREDIDP